MLSVRLRYYGRNSNSIVFQSALEKCCAHARPTKIRLRSEALLHRQLSGCLPDLACSRCVSISRGCSLARFIAARLGLIQLNAVTCRSANPPDWIRQTRLAVFLLRLILIVYYLCRCHTINCNLSRCTARDLRDAIFHLAVQGEMYDGRGHPLEKKIIKHKARVKSKRKAGGIVFVGIFKSDRSDLVRTT